MRGIFLDMAPVSNTKFISLSVKEPRKNQLTGRERRDECLLIVELPSTPLSSPPDIISMYPKDTIQRGALRGEENERQRRQYIKDHGDDNLTQYIHLRDHAGLYRALKIRSTDSSTMPFLLGRHHQRHPTGLLLFLLPLLYVTARGVARKPSVVGFSRQRVGQTLDRSNIIQNAKDVSSSREKEKIARVRNDR